MALNPYMNSVAVDATGYNIYNPGTTDPFRVKNVGENTVYVGHVRHDSTDPVNINASYPLAPGESVLVPGFDSASGGAIRTVGFNTASGTSNVRILDHQD